MFVAQRLVVSDEDKAPPPTFPQLISDIQSGDVARATIKTESNEVSATLKDGTKIDTGYIPDDSQALTNALDEANVPYEVKGIPGEHAFRIKASKGVNPWDVQASSPIQGAINEGDVIMLMYYARAEKAAEGGIKLTARIQLAGPPYSSVLDFTTPVDGEWKSHCAFRVANAAIAEKKSSVSIHLATA